MSKDFVHYIVKGEEVDLNGNRRSFFQFIIALPGGADPARYPAGPPPCTIELAQEMVNMVYYIHNGRWVVESVEPYS